MRGKTRAGSSPEASSNKVARPEMAPAVHLDLPVCAACRSAPMRSRSDRRESVARATLPTQRVEQWQKPSLQAWSRLARHVLLLLPVSSNSLATAQPHAPTHTPVHGVMLWHGPQGSGPACRLPAARMRTACGAACSTCKPPWPSCPRAKASLFWLIVTFYKKRLRSLVCIARSLAPPPRAC